MNREKVEIFITGEVTTDAANELQKEIDFIKGSEGVKKVVFRINSNGGSVVAGLAMYDAISALSGVVETEAFIYGVCGSAATYPALACDRVKISPNATFFIHLCEGGLYGTIEQIQADLVFFENLQNQVVAIYCAKTGRDAEAIYNEIETPKYYTAQQALELGWVDEIVGATEELLNLTNKAEVVMTEAEVKAEADNNTPIFSLSNLLKKCKDLIKGSNELDTMQNRLDDYAKQVTELENANKALIAANEANNAELKNKIEQLEFEKATLQKTIDNEVNNRLAAMGYDFQQMPTATNNVKQKDFRKVVREQGLNAALNLLLNQ